MTTWHRQSRRPNLHSRILLGWSTVMDLLTGKRLAVDIYARPGEPCQFRMNTPLYLSRIAPVELYAHTWTEFSLSHRLGLSTPTPVEFQIVAVELGPASGAMCQIIERIHSTPPNNPQAWTLTLSHISDVDAEWLAGHNLDSQ